MRKVFKITDAEREQFNSVRAYGDALEFACQLDSRIWDITVGSCLEDGKFAYEVTWKLKTVEGK